MDYSRVRKAQMATLIDQLRKENKSLKRRLTICKGKLRNSRESVRAMAESLIVLHNTK